MGAFANDKGTASLEIPLRVLSDASAWLVRLSGPLRTPAAEQGFQRWLEESTLHRIAFQRVSAEWDEADQLKRFTDVEIRMPARDGAQKQPSAPRRIDRRFIAAAAALVLVAMAGIHYGLKAPQITTGINELRVVTLEDGSKLHLNTATNVTVSFDKTRRHILLESGEALFEVAQHPSWPFTVAAGDRQVQALGTSFLVRRDAHRVAVTLMDGQIAVSSREAGQQGAPETPVHPQPGERLTFVEAQSSAQRDRPQVDKLLAWQSGKVAIDDMPLAEAVAEMNRYSSTPVALERPQPPQLRVSGVFIAGQSRSFARAIAESYGLEVVDRGDRIVLAGVGRSAVP